MLGSTNNDFKSPNFILTNSPLVIWFNTSNIITAGKQKLSSHSNIIWMRNCRWANTGQPIVQPCQKTQMNKHRATRRSNQQKTPNSSKNGENRCGATRHFPKYLNGCRNSRNMWKRDAHASFLHGLSPEPPRQMVSDKNSVRTYFPKNRNYKSSLKWTHKWSHTSCRKFLR